MKKRQYGSKENASVKSSTGNEFNEGSTKFNALIKKRMAKKKKHSKEDMKAAAKHMEMHKR